MFITVNQEIIDNQNNNQNNGEKRKTFLKLEDGEQVFVQMMLDADAFVGYYRHTQQINGKWEYIHCADPKTCPCCQKKMGRKLRTLIPMIVADDQKGTNPRIQIFDASINDVKEFYIAKEECKEEEIDFTQTIFKFKRIGQKLDTTYRLTATRGKAETFKGGLDVKLPDWEKLIKFPTPAEVEAILGSGQMPSTNQVVDNGLEPMPANDPFSNNNFAEDAGDMFAPQDDSDMPF